MAVYANLKEFNAGAVIFREGEKSDCMYEVEKGKVDLYIDFNKPGQKKIAEIGPERIFGEMGMVEGLPRSATAVAAVDGTELTQVTWELFGLYFKKKPAKVVMIMQQMGDRLRLTTKSAMDLKTKVNEAVELMQNGGDNYQVLSKLKSGIREMERTMDNNK